MTSDMLSPDELAAIRERAEEMRGNVLGGVETIRLIDDDLPRLLRHIEALQQELRQVKGEYAAGLENIEAAGIARNTFSNRISDAEGRAEAAQKRAEGLRTALEEQWEAAHAEHCRNEWPHDGHCTWPKPAVLEDTANGA